MRRSRLALLAVLASLAWGAPARAASIAYEFYLSPASSLAVSNPWLGSAGPLSIQGRVTGSVEVAVDTPLTLTSTTLAIADFSVPVYGDLEHGVVSVHFSGVTGHLAGGPTPALGPPFPLEWDTDGFELWIDSGTAFWDDTGYTAPLTPFAFVFGPGVISYDPASSGPVLIPVSATADFGFSQLALSGTLVLVAVPEPGTLGLVLAGLAALAAGRRTPR
jgi:hypothetical protein